MQYCALMPVAFTSSLLARLLIAAVMECSMAYALETLQSSSVRLSSFNEYIKEAFSRKSFRRVSLERTHPNMGTDCGSQMESKTAMTLTDSVDMAMCGQHPNMGSLLLISGPARYECSLPRSCPVRLGCGW